MKVRIKGKDQTGFEKRNTAIMIFGSVALIPLLLALFSGYELGDTKTVNNENLHSLVNTKDQEIEKLKAELKEVNGNLNQLEQVFSNVDSLFEEFQNGSIAELQNDLKHAENELDFDNWHIEKERKFNKFNAHVKSVFDDPSEAEKIIQMNSVMAYGKKWMLDYSVTKGREFNARKINRKIDTGTDVESDYEDQVNDLESDLKAIQLDLKICQGQQALGQQGGALEARENNIELKGNSKALEEKEKEIEEKEKELTDSMARYRRVVETNKDVQRSVENETKALLEDILPELRRELINGKKFEKAKKKLEAKINGIAAKTGTLTTN